MVCSPQSLSSRHRNGLLVSAHRQDYVLRSTCRIDTIDPIPSFPSSPCPPGRAQNDHPTWRGPRRVLLAAVRARSRSRASSRRAPSTVPPAPALRLPLTPCVSTAPSAPSASAPSVASTSSSSSPSPPSPELVRPGGRTVSSPRPSLPPRSTAASRASSASPLPSAAPAASSKSSSAWCRAAPAATRPPSALLPSRSAPKPTAALRTPPHRVHPCHPPDLADVTLISA
mmetsp:Transcript_7791/g.23833  ORF Transcript_7791/g.23833 Transcript_7791/m.23833 type:complete len:228 (+) Transcript_7791:335-1018(+)